MVRAFFEITTKYEFFVKSHEMKEWICLKLNKNTLIYQSRLKVHWDIPKVYWDIQKVYWNIPKVYWSIQENGESILENSKTTKITSSKYRNNKGN